MLLPELLGWSYSGLGDPLRKAFEVALHAGTAVALIGGLRGVEIRPGHATVTLLPAALVGLLAESAIERSLGAPRQVALVQMLAGAALILADLRVADRERNQERLGDALVLGVAQACALMPGVSRGGASLTAARALGFERSAAAALARDAALPVLVAASALKALRLTRQGLPRPLRPGFAAGALVAFGSTFVVARLELAVEARSTYLAIGAYRMALGALSLRRLRGRR